MSEEESLASPTKRVKKGDLFASSDPTLPKDNEKDSSSLNTSLNLGNDTGESRANDTDKSKRKRGRPKWKSISTDANQVMEANSMNGEAANVNDVRISKNPRPSLQQVERVLTELRENYLDDVSVLKSYKPFSCETYGELEPILVDEIIKK